MEKGNETVEKWKSVILFYYEKGEITGENKNRLISLFSEPEIRTALNRATDPSVSEEHMKETVQDSLSTLRKMYEQRDEADHVMTGELLEKYRRIKERWGKNVEKYINENYETARIYLIFSKVFHGLGKNLIDILEQQVCYKKYGKYGTLDGNYYCQSPVKDLVISNVSRGALYKRMPKDMENKAEYDYDKDGRLILYKWLIGARAASFTEVLLYGETEIIHIRYGNMKGDIQMISIQDYQKDNIKSYEKAHFIEGHIYDLEKESYEYGDGFLRSVWSEECSFPKRVRGGRINYIFEKDEEGYLIGYRQKDYCGDGEIDSLLNYYETNDMEVNKEEYEALKDQVMLLPEKKRKDTGRNAVRWRRPNYFLE